MNRALLGVVLLLMVAWNVVEAGRIAGRRALPAWFRVASGLAGFLIVPAYLLAIGSASVITGRALGGLGWFWIVALALALGQAATAWLLGMVGAWVAVPLITYDALLLGVAAVRYAAALGYEPAVPLLLPGHAVAQLFALALGTGWFASPAALLLPLLAPARAAAAVFGRASRIGLATVAAILVCAIAWRAQPAWRALRGYEGLGLDRATELITNRPRGDLLIGLDILPSLSAAPSAAPLREDLELAESLGVHTIGVHVRIDRASAATLDSLDRALEPLRRDSTSLMVNFALGSDAARDPAAAEREDGRLTTDLERLVRRLRPERLVVEIPEDAGAGVVDAVLLDDLKRRLEQIASIVRREQPRTRVLLQSGVRAPRDSALHEWAMGSATSLAGAVTPLGADASGAAGISASLATIERWTDRTNALHEQWIVVAGVPVLEGEAAQRRLMRHVLVWAASRPFVRGVVLATATDYDRMTGLRAASGRLRQAVTEAAETVHILSDTTRALP